MQNTISDEQTQEIYTKINEIIKNQETFNKKVDKLYDALIGNELTANKGFIHDIHSFKEYIEREINERDKRITNLEKFADKLKNYYTVMTFVFVIIGFFIELLWQYILNVIKSK
jgi:fructose-bisphosphate aldolase class 1